MLKPRQTPCGSCPYRRDCPSGVWHADEYNKLIEYDKDTCNQPMGVFMCHSDNDNITICRGWLDAHPKDQSIALRLAVSFGHLTHEIFDLPKSDVPVFSSGKDAAEHGKRDITNISEKAADVIDKLLVARGKRTSKRRKKGTK